MPVVLLLLHLLPRDVYIRAAHRDYVVATVGRGVVDGFVLAHEHEGDLRGDAAEGARIGGEVDEVPGSGVG